MPSMIFMLSNIFLPWMIFSAVDNVCRFLLLISAVDDSQCDVFQCDVCRWDVFRWDVVRWDVFLLDVFFCEMMFSGMILCGMFFCGMMFCGHLFCFQDFGTKSGAACNACLIRCCQTVFGVSQILRETPAFLVACVFDVLFMSCVVLSLDLICWNEMKSNE